MRKIDVRQLLCRMLKDGRTDVHDEERSRWHIVVIDKHVQNNDKKVRYNTASGDLPQISRTFFQEVTPKC